MSESGCFSLDIASLPDPAEKPVAVPLGADLAVIRAEGADTLPFFNRIFTNRVEKIGEGAMISGWADAKGRLIAAPRLVRAAPDALYLIVPKDTAEALAKKLRMYIFRSKVTLSDAGEEAAPAGLLGTGEGVSAALAAAGAALPEAAWGVSKAEGLTAVRLPDAAEEVPALGAARVRVLLLGTAGAIAKTGAAEASQSGLWWLSEIAARVPSVFAGSVGKFIPQGIALDELGGVSFNKGCYPGQELIARVHNHPEKFGKKLAFVRTKAEVPAAGADCEAGVAVEAVKIGDETFALMQAAA